VGTDDEEDEELLEMGRYEEDEEVESGRD